MKPVLISKRLNLPQYDRTDTNFIAPLRTHFYRSKSTLGSLKSVFNVCRSKRSLGALVTQGHPTSIFGK